MAPVADEQGSYLEPVDEAEAESWCLYGHLPGQGLKSIGTFRSRSQAEAVYAGITGHAYRHTGRRNIPWNSAA